MVEKHGKLRVAVEIKAKPHIVGADCRGLRSFSEAHPEVPCIVTCSTPERYRIDDIQVIPYRQFLIEFTRWL